MTYYYLRKIIVQDEFRRLGFTRMYFCFLSVPKGKIITHEPSTQHVIVGTGPGKEEPALASANHPPPSHGAHLGLVSLELIKCPEETEHPTIVGTWTLREVTCRWSVSPREMGHKSLS